MIVPPHHVKMVLHAWTESIRTLASVFQVLMVTTVKMVCDFVVYIGWGLETRTRKYWKVLFTIGSIR